MRTGTRGIDLIKQFEGLVDGDPETPGLDAYLCPANVVTIGWGHVVRDADGAPYEGEAGLATVHDCIYPDGITRPQAEALLRSDLDWAEADVRQAVTVGLCQHQFDALVSFTFNLGGANLRSSTLLKRLNAGDARGAAGEFWKWRRANGEILRGLVRRRAAEKALFLDGAEAPDND